LEDKIEAGRISCKRAGSKSFIIDHTEVNADFRGKSIGIQLVNEVFRFACKNEHMVISQCPFAKGVFNKNIEYQDVINH